MSLDLSQFSEVFFEEANEHLSEMEERLLACDVANPDAESLNAIFRAAHSIKGGAGAFGYMELTSVTHILETLLDRVRKKDLPLSQDMIEACLRARDVLAEMVAAYRGGSALPHGEIEAVTALLEGLTRGEAPLRTARTVQASDANIDASRYRHQNGLSVTPPNGCLQVRIAAGDAIDEDGVLACLKSYGEVIEHRHGDGELPWSYICRTERSAADVYETLTFLIHPDRLAINAAPSGAAETDHPQCAEEHDGYGFFVPVPASPAAALTAAESPEQTRTWPPMQALTQARVETVMHAPAGVQDERAKEHASACAVLASGAAQPTGSASSARATPSLATQEGVAAKSNAPSASIRVSVEKVDQLLNLVGELVITQSMRAQTALDMREGANEHFSAGISQLERNSRELQEAVMSIRMLPISLVFQRFPRVVRDLAKQLDKEVELEMADESTELDKSFIEKLSDPLMHLVRNSVDHGIEPPDVRAARGKPRVGKLKLRAYQEGSDIAIEVADDGAGLNGERILAKTRENGLDVSDALSDREVMLPSDDPACQRQRGGLSSLYSVNAMEVLINGMLRLGASRTRIVTKLFGGGNVINTMGATRIGERNAEFMRTYLTREGIKVASMDLRGDYPRKVCYFTSSGRALAKGLRSRQAIVEVSSKEQAYDGSLRRDLSHAGEVELF